MRVTGGLRWARTLLATALAALLVTLAYPALAKPLAKGDAARSFDSLKTLAGEWTGTTATGRSLAVSYKIIANGSVIVETWTLGPGRVSMTVYHLDGDDLIATHYCPIGNQPRLELSRLPESGRYDFAFRDATGLKSRLTAHQDSFWIALHDINSMTRSETCVENRKGESETVAFRRTTAP